MVRRFSTYMHNYTQTSFQKLLFLNSEGLKTYKSGKNMHRSFWLNTMLLLLSVFGLGKQKLDILELPKYEVQLYMELSQLKMFPTVAQKNVHLSGVVCFFMHFFSIISYCSVFNCLNRCFTEYWTILKYWFGQQFWCESTCT